MLVYNVLSLIFSRFAFPALSLPAEISVTGTPKKLSEVYPDEVCRQLAKAYLYWKRENPLVSGYFTIVFDDQVGTCLAVIESAFLCND